MNLTRYEYTMMHLSGVGSAMIAGWTLSEDVGGVFLAGLLGTIMVSIAFYPENRERPDTDG